MTSLGRASLLIASNRGPISVSPAEGDDPQITRGSGGLVSGMQVALSSVPEAVWVCAAMNDTERAMVHEAGAGRFSDLPAVADALGGEFAVRMLDIDEETFHNAYNGIANSTLWFLLHTLYDFTQDPTFDAEWREHWNSYVQYNQIFADALAAEAARGAEVVIEDYHLFLVPKMLRDLRPDVRIGFFTHIPWVSPEYFSVLPDDIARAIIEGMLGADMLGFHTSRWANLFSACARAVVGREPAGVQVFPLGTDAAEISEQAAQPDVDEALAALDAIVGDRLLIGRVDRTEPAKNVYRGLLAYRELLRAHPQWRDRVVHAVYNNPSREELAIYRDSTEAIEKLATEINDEFSTPTWTPLLVDVTDDFPAALAILRRSDVLLINSIRDGMNLVVLEGVIVSERAPAVVLSREAGAADLLGDDAILVNPFDVSGVADALHAALLMPEPERAGRIARMQKAAVRLPPAAWFRAQLDALDMAQPLGASARQRPKQRQDTVRSIDHKVDRADRFGQLRHLDRVGADSESRQPGVA